jgi:thioesterase domain-containing protein
MTVAADGVEAVGGAVAHNVARVAEVAGWLVAGLNSTDVVQRAQAEWGISERTAQRLLARARAELVAGWDSVERSTMLAMLLARLDKVFREAMEAKNHGAALGAINAQAKLAKL